MKVAGIIAEYNPFHNGHFYHLEQTQLLSGCDYTIVMLAGNFVQRGEPAIVNKFQRTEWALRAGADLVLELPTIFATASAARFAYGGVRILCETGVLTHLSFGSEVCNIEQMKKLASLLHHETKEFQSAMKCALQTGKSYPRARWEALENIGISSDLLETIKSPNSLLGVEYLRYLEEFGPQVEPIALQRIGEYSAQELTGKFSSATALRRALLVGHMGVRAMLPGFVAETINGQEMISLEQAEPLILYTLRRMSIEELGNIADIQEGFEHVLYREIRRCATLFQLLNAMKTKRYTLARCRRILIAALLGITKEKMQLAMNRQDALYARVLGFKRSARPLLSAIRRYATIPIVARNADISLCAAPAQECIELDRLASDIYVQMTGGKTQRDFSTHPILL